jgi:hypothetical protein
MSIPIPNTIEQEISDNNRKLSIITTNGSIWPNSLIVDNQQDPITLYPLENTQSNPLPSKAPSKYRPSSSVSDDIPHPQIPSSQHLRRTTTPDLGHLDPEEQAALEAEITARRAARRISRRQMSYSEYEDEEEDDERVVMGTRVSEGHPNYQLM